jgi:hypothetical protein
MKKKGLDMQNEVLKTVIISLIFIIVFFPIVSRVFGFIRVNTEDSKCTTTVKLASQTMKSLAGQTTGILCPTRNHSLKSESSDLTKRKEKVFDKILDAQYHCAKKFGFEDGVAKYNPFAFQGRACVICDTFEFDTDIKALKKQKGYFEYAAEKKIPLKNKYFYEFITGKPVTDEEKNIIKTLDDTIDFEKEQMVLFTLYTEYNKDKLVKYGTLGAGVGTGVGGATGVGAGITTAAIITLIPGVNVGFWTVVGVGFVTGAVTGAITGGALGTGVAAVTSKTYPASILIMPKDYALTRDLDCKILGNKYENPFEVEIA